MESKYLEMWIVYSLPEGGKKKKSKQKEKGREKKKL